MSGTGQRTYLQRRVLGRDKPNDTGSEVRSGPNQNEEILTEIQAYSCERDGEVNCTIVSHSIPAFTSAPAFHHVHMYPVLSSFFNMF